MDAQADQEQRPCIPPGKYQLAFVDWRTHLMFGRAAKLELVFKVADFGPYFETILSRWYNVKRLKGKPGKHGQFVFTWSGDFIREYATLFGLPQRADRIAMTKFKGRMFHATVRTVTTTGDRKALPAVLHYSVIESLDGEVAK